jgi:hypothetical protein
MRLTTNPFLFATFGLGALGLAAVAQTQNPQAANVSAWIQSTPNRAMLDCPASKATETAQNPWFGFGKLTNPMMASCMEDGPYSWSGNLWYVQRLKGFEFTDGTKDAIRVCSPAAVDLGRTSHFAGPCRTKDGAGPKGCELCVVGGVVL